MSNHHAPVTITAVSSDDADGLVEVERLAEAAFDSLEGVRGGPLLRAARRLDTPERLAGAIARGEAVGLLARYAGASVGIGIVRRDEQGPHVLAFAEVLYVEPDAREVGVGEALLEAMGDWARDSGAVGLDVPVLPGSRPAKSFLEEMGYRARLLVMHRATPTEDGARPA